MKKRFWMKWLLTAVFMVMVSGQIMAQKNIDKLIEEIEKRDDISINTVTRRNTETRKITSSIKNFSLTDEKLAKQLVAAFEKDEEMATTAIKDMPKGRNGQKKSITLVFTLGKETKHYTLDISANGKFSVNVIIRPKSEKKNKPQAYFNKEEFNQQMNESLKSLEAFKDMDLNNLMDEVKVVMN